MRRRSPRRFWVWVHRWIGLTTALFLVIVGLTGSILAYYGELDRALNPGLLTVPLRETPMLDPFVLRERVEAMEPHARVDSVNLDLEPGLAYQALVVPKVDPTTGEEYVLPYDVVFVDPYTGERLGERSWGEASLAPKGLMPFIYRIHYSLASPASMGLFGIYALGIVALLWTLDCFIGFYLTLPRVRRSRRHTPTPQPSWWRRWRPAWFVKWNVGAFRANYDLHRAAGLWVWPMLFVLAWSSVALNLTDVYDPVTALVFGPRSNDVVPATARASGATLLDWRTAHGIGQHLVTDVADRYGFAVVREEFLELDSATGVFAYGVRSSADRGKSSATRVRFDAYTGAELSFAWPGNEPTSETVTRWLIALHTARVFGPLMQVFVCVMGVVLTLLSGTGVYLWWKKRGVRVRLHQRRLISNNVSVAAQASHTRF